MNHQRKHISFGIWGIYLFFITCYVLISGIFQMVNTIHHYSELGLIGFNRLDYKEFAVYMYVRFATFLSVGVVRTLIGGIGSRA